MIKFILAACLTLTLCAFSGCAGFQTQQQKIAATCESVASAADALAAARNAGRITQAQQDDAIRIYKTTVQFCQPPASSLDAVKYAALTAAAAELTARAGGVK